MALRSRIARIAVLGALLVPLPAAPGQAHLTGTSVPDRTTLLVLLSLSTALATVIAVAVDRWCEHRARDRGLLDQTTGS